MKRKNSQIRIESVDIESSKRTVEKILLAAAVKFNLYDNSHTSRVPNTIRSIVEGNGFGSGLGARVVKNSIFVDFYEPWNGQEKFQEVHDYILNELQTTFRVRLQEISEDNPEYFGTH